LGSRLAPRRIIGLASSGRLDIRCV
jgi:hypothetical protein